MDVLLIHHNYVFLIRNMPIRQIVKQLTAIYFHNCVNGLYPQEHGIEVNYSKNSALCILPVHYAYFLLFLCAYHSKDAINQLTLLGVLETLIYDKRFGMSSVSSSITLNMVGICNEL